MLTTASMELGMNKKDKQDLASKGGQARASSLSKEDRSAIARAAAEARWGTKGKDVLKATHIGEICIGDVVIPCAVLNDGTRVISQRGLASGLGGGTPSSRRPEISDDDKTPPFLTAHSLKPYISDELAAKLKNPIHYSNKGPDRARGGGAIAYGINALLLPDILSIWIDAMIAGALHHKQIEFARHAAILQKGLSKVGVVALVDEATGYQAERARDELTKILEAYISEELLKWTKKFPDEFFRQIYRLHGWEYKPGVTQGPRYVGQFINKYIYEKLPPGVLDELRARNPALDGYRKHKHFQLLTDHTGHPHLDGLIIGVTTLMRAARSREMFEDLFKEAYPSKGDQRILHFPPSPEEPIEE
jgi:hypothetical protein